jgi:uncharacterized protein (DUF952 family)
MLIYHILSKVEWKKFQSVGEYSPLSLIKDGFIHASTKNQILPTANRIYKRKSNLIVLKIDTNKISAKIVSEYSKGSKENHPHIYGKIPLTAIISSYNLISDEDGVFRKLF